MYLYKTENDQKHVKLHNLSGFFLEETGTVINDNQQFYTFCLQTGLQLEKFATDKYDEFMNWMICLKRITGYTEIDNSYEFINTLAEGRFGTVKLAKHRETERKVAVKIINKSNLATEDVTQIKSEIEVLKISQHPNLIQLYDIIEDKSTMYIGK
jgi:serine/threonine protein kinase